MAMRMPPDVAQQSVLPDINRTSLVFFGGLSLIVLNFYWSNPNFVMGIFTKGEGNQVFRGVLDNLAQVLGLLILVGLAQYGGENAGTAALMFVGALWLLWLVNHFGTAPEPAPSHSETGISGGSGGQKK